MSKFKYVQYEGDDASDVLVTLLMNLNYPSGVGEDGEVHEHESSVADGAEKPERIVGFAPNPEEEEDEDE